MQLTNELKKSFLISIWFMFLTFPLLVIKVDSIEKVVTWRWENMAYVAIGAFFISLFIRYITWRKEQSSPEESRREIVLGPIRTFFPPPGTAGVVLAFCLWPLSSFPMFFPPIRPTS
jgi:branched-chain amino acid transport system permease protein